MTFVARRARQIILLLGDLVCLGIGLYTALAIRYGFPTSPETLRLHLAPFIIIFIFWVLSFFISGLYSLKNAQNNRTFFAIFFSSFGLNIAIAALFFYFIPYFSISPKIVLFFDVGITLAALTLWRIFFNSSVPLPPRKLAIFGSGKELDELIADMQKHPQQGYKCALHSHSLPPDLPAVIKTNHIDTVVIAIDYRRSPEIQNSLFACISLHIRFIDFVDFYEQYFQKIPLAVIDRAWFLENLNEAGKRFFSLLKRGLDLVFAAFLGMIGIVLFPLIALALLVDSGGPLLYSQMRVGQFEKPFRIYKFRSMKQDDNASTVTRVGRFLRASHLDEIPQLWNILLGEMSFVGPRPEQVHLVHDLKAKIPFYNERLLVRPGITGWAQLHEPHAKAEDALEKLQYDLFYVKHRSLILDSEIILKTLRILLGWGHGSRHSAVSQKNPSNI